MILVSGVLAGSLATSVLDPAVCLVGSSGGVYSLLAAHLANLVLNYPAMRWAALRLTAILAIASVEVSFSFQTKLNQIVTKHLCFLKVGVAVYGRYADTGPPVSYLAHIWGSLAGVSIGLVILKNFQQRLWERWVWWVALFTYSAFIIAAFVLNLLA